MFYLFSIIYLILSERIQCPEGQGIDTSTNSCITCPLGQGIIETGECGICSSNEGLNPITGKCEICSEDECIGLNGICTNPNNINATIDQNNKRCVCPNFYGFNNIGVCSKCEDNDYCVDPKTRKCIQRDDFHGIDKVTGECKICIGGEAINRFTNYCEPCPQNSFISSTCYCPGGLSYDPETNDCTYCKEGEYAIDDNFCGVCKKGFGINYDRCHECGSSQGVDPITNECRNFEDNEGNDPQTGKIITCPPGTTRLSDIDNICGCQNLDSEHTYGFLPNGECGICQENEGIDPETGNCSQCKENQGLDYANKCTECKSYQYIDPDTKKCTSKSDSFDYCYLPGEDYIKVTTEFVRYERICKCQNSNEKIDRVTHQCRECKSYEYVYDSSVCEECPYNLNTGTFMCIDPDDNTCRYLNDKETINLTNHFCQKCEDGYGIDQESKICVLIKYNQCIKSESGEIYQLEEGRIRDHSTKECKCPDQQGFLYNYSCGFCPENEGIKANFQCGSCSNDECIDPVTRKCRSFNENEGMSFTTYECIQCPENTQYDSNTNSCKCNDSNKGFNSETRQCVQCNEGEYVDEETYQCKRCENGKGIIDGKCQICPILQGVNNKTRKCETCPEGEGILPKINICGKCPENSLYNSETGKCQCFLGFIELDSGECEQCKEGQIPNDDLSYCMSCDSNKCINQTTYQCTYVSELEENVGRNPLTAFCTKCPEGSSVVNDVCKCNDNKGFNSDYTECIECGPLEGIDYTGRCARCEDNKCLDPSTRECTYLPYGFSINRTTLECIPENECPRYEINTRYCECPANSVNYDNYCECRSDEGIDSITYSCVKCPFKQGMDSSTRICRECPKDSCIDSSGYCQTISYYGGVNQTDGQCIYQCDVGKGFDPETKYCVECKDNECIDDQSKRCRLLLETEEAEATTKKCQCKNKKGYNESKICIELQDNECINPDGYIVPIRYPYEYVDPTTRKCLNNCYQGYDPLTKECGVCAKGTYVGYSGCQCPKFQGILNDSYECGTCPEGQGIDDNSNRCRICPLGMAIDEFSKKCVTCDPGYGVDPIKKVCVKCPEGIDKITGECISCGRNEGISDRSGKCIPCVYPNILDPETNICHCPQGQVFDNLDICITCSEGINPETFDCMLCEYYGLGIDHDSRFCRRCNIDEGIDPISKECVKCKEGTSILDSRYCKCPSKQGYDINNKKCITCEKGKGIDPETNKCIYCGNSNGIDPDTLMCRDCPIGYGIDPETFMCTICPNGYDQRTGLCITCTDGQGALIDYGYCEYCSQYSDLMLDEATKRCFCTGKRGYDENDRCHECPPMQGIDPKNGKCIVCPYGQGINELDGRCTPCNENEGKNDLTNECTMCQDGYGILFNGYCGTCLDSQTIDKSNNKCKCPEKQGLNITENKCVTCNIYEGIDPINNICRECNNSIGEGIDPETKICRQCEAINPINGECVICPEGSQPNPITHYCECTDKKGYNPVNNECALCANGEGIISETMICGRCPNGLGIDESTGICTKCKEGKGIDPTSRKCIDCPSGSINSVNGECTTCNDSQIKDETSKKCICPLKQGLNNEMICSECSSGQGIDPITYQCKYCEELQCIDESTGFCSEIPEGYGKDPETYKCHKCPENTFYDKNAHMCRCGFGFGFDQETGKCVTCPFGIGINQTTYKCEKCQFGVGIDPDSNLCVELSKDRCINRRTGLWESTSSNQRRETSSNLCTCLYGGEGFDELYTKCQECKDGEGVDTNTGKCTICSEGYGIDIFSKQCISCTGDKKVEEGTNLCICADKKGFQYYSCVNCSSTFSKDYGIDFKEKTCRRCVIENKEGIDKETGYCRFCNDNEGLDSDTFECVLCPENSQPDPKTHYCRCDEGLGFDPESNKCTSCDASLNYGIDILSGVCRLCNGEDEKIDAKTNNCLCINNKGFDRNTHKCVNCNEVYSPYGGIDEETGICRQCDDTIHEGVDGETYKCKQCNENEGINPYNGNCEVCPEGSRANPDIGYKCECENGLGIDKNNRCSKCDDFEGINENNKRCEKCSDHYAIDPESRVCKYCSEYNNDCINRFTGECIEMTDALTANSDYYCECKYNYGFDPVTHECVNCRNQNMGVDYINGTCVTCKGGSVPDTKTNKCVCPTKMGFDSEYENCIECPQNYGIDPFSMKCESSHIYGQCIDLVTGFWVNPVENQYPGPFYLCTCYDNYEFNPISNKCEKCKDGQFVDPITKKCTDCSGKDLGTFNGACTNCTLLDGFPDPITHKCTCGPNKGFNNNKCYNCSNNGKWWGIDEETSMCIFCPNVQNHCIDTKTLICREKREDEGIDHEIERCNLCVGGQKVNPNTDECSCAEGLGFDEYNQACIDCTSIPGYAIDILTNKCILCSDSDKIIDPLTKECKCANGKGLMEVYEYYYCVNCTEARMGIDRETGKCISCDYYRHEGIDPITGYCRECEENEGIMNNNQCQICDEDKSPDPNNYYACKCANGLGIKDDNKCGVCNFGEGINTNNNKCEKCSKKLGIDLETRECIFWHPSSEQCINRTSFEMIPIPDGFKPDQNGYCSCLNGFGFDPSTGNCIECVGTNIGVNWDNGNCMTCGNGQFVDKDNYCNCPDKKAFDSEYKNCVNCKVNEGIDENTLQCSKTDSVSLCISPKTGMWTHTWLSYRDEETGICTCYQGMYYNSTIDKCQSCDDDDEIYNPIKNVCMKCSPGFAINFITGECETCPNDQIYDDDFQKCICKDKKGFDSNYKCVECPKGYGISPYTLKCEKENEYQCIDYELGMLVPLNFVIHKDPETGICKCENGYGFDINSYPLCKPCKSNEVVNPITSKCEKCPTGQVINPLTKQCVYCDFGEGINQITMRCEKCSPGQGVDPVYRSCKDCNNDEGINKVSGICEKCSSLQAIDPITRTCGVCKKGYGIDSSQSFCRKCSDNKCVMCSSDYNYCSFCNDGYISNNGVCVSSNIQVVEPTPKPNIEKIDYNKDENTNTITVKKPNDASANKNYEVEIPSIENDKTVVIPDMSKANVGLLIHESIQQLTIVPNVNSPLDIVINFQNTDDNENNENPVIVIDAENTANLDTSVKGEGKLTLQNKNENDALQLNQVVPNKDSQITIQSNSQVHIKQIDIYGNSKVEFTNTKEKAVVNLITLQQKSSTELDNVVIDGDLKTGLYSTILLKENVNIENTNIEIAISNENQNTNPTLEGSLSSPPKQITIQHRNIDSLLNENNVVIVAESDKERFKCKEWADSFDRNSDPFYNNADCIDSGKNLKRLILNHKDPDSKKGLGAGPIAGIVIAVVVIVAVVILLVYFFVIRKKKSYSISENESMSDKEENYIQSSDSNNFEINEI